MSAWLSMDWIAPTPNGRHPRLWATICFLEWYLPRPVASRRGGCSGSGPRNGSVGPRSDNAGRHGSVHRPCERLEHPWGQHHRLLGRIAALAMEIEDRMAVAVGEMLAVRPGEFSTGPVG
jgi:hypothetical protein